MSIYYVIYEWIFKYYHLLILVHATESETKGNKKDETRWRQYIAGIAGWWYFVLSNKDSVKFQINNKI